MTIFTDLSVVFRTQNRVYSSNINVALCMLPPECVRLLIYADVIRGHVTIHSGLIAIVNKTQSKLLLVRNYYFYKPIFSSRL